MPLTALPTHVLNVINYPTIKLARHFHSVGAGLTGSRDWMPDSVLQWASRGGGLALEQACLLEGTPIIPLISMMMYVVVSTLLVELKML